MVVVLEAGGETGNSLCYKKITVSGWRMDWRGTRQRQGCPSESCCGAPGGRMKPFYPPVTRSTFHKANRVIFLGFACFGH